MRRRVLLVGVAAFLLAGCGSRHPMQPQSSMLPHRAPKGTSVPAPASSSPGYLTSLGICGPSMPLRRATFVVEVMPDGTHPTCASISPHENVRVVNMTRMSGSAGCSLSIGLAGQRRRTVAAGGNLIIRSSAQWHKNLRDVLRAAGTCEGPSRVVLWRVDRRDRTLSANPSP